MRQNVLPKIIRSSYAITMSAILFASSPSVCYAEQIDTSISESATPAPQCDSRVSAFYSNSVFIGDSILVGYKAYSQRIETSATHNAQFLCSKGFSAYHALRADKSIKNHPEYNGVKQAIWTSVSQMNVDKVFIYLGTNDLVGINPDESSTNTIEVANRIHQAKPEATIYIIGIAPAYAGTSKGCLNSTDIATYDNLLMDKAHMSGFHYINLSDCLKGEDGNIRPELSGDRYVHINNAAYDIWNQVMSDYALNQLQE